MTTAPPSLPEEPLPAGLCVRLLSDAVFARGEGTAGVVDVEVDHDDYGLPVLRGKTLHGLLLDAWLTMADAFGRLAPAAARLLGEEADLRESATLGLGDAVLEPTLTAWLRYAVDREDHSLSPWAVLDALTEVRSQTAQERDGTPADGTLRSTRRVLRDTRLIAPVDWFAPPGDDEVEVLGLAARSVRNAGLGRNRGAGRVTLEVVAGTAEAVRRPTPSRAELPTSPPPPGARVRYLPFTLALRAALIFSTPAGGSDRVATLPYAPGRALRGCVADRARELLDVLVLGDHVRYLNAYPLPTGSDERPLPTPASLRAPRDPDQGVDPHPPLTDLLAYPHDAPDRGDRWPAEALVAPKPYLTLGEDGDRLPATSRQMTQVHHRRDRIAGRAWTLRRNGQPDEARGALFSYSALCPDQRFGGSIQLRGEDDAALDALERAIRDLLSGRLHLGRSRRAGYGGACEVSFGDARSREAEGVAAPTLDADVEAGERFCVLLASDCLARDEATGQADPCAVEALLEAALPVRVIDRHWQTGTVGGYNRHWRLPAGTWTALAGGSVLLVRAERGIPLDDLLEVEHDGLGERRSEGFGRLALLKVEAEEEGEEAPGSAERPARRVRYADWPPAWPDPPASGGDDAEVIRVQKRLVRRAVELKLAEEVRDLTRDASACPTASLIGRMRRPLPDGSGPGAGSGPGEIKVWVKGLSKDSPQWKQLERCKLRRGETLAAWLLRQPGERLAFLGPVANRTYVVSPASAADALRGLEQWADGRLVDTLLATLALRHRGGG